MDIESLMSESDMESPTEEMPDRSSISINAEYYIADIAVSAFQRSPGGGPASASRRAAENPVAVPTLVVAQLPRVEGLQKWASTGTHNDKCPRWGGSDPTTTPDPTSRDRQHPAREYQVGIREAAVPVLHHTRVEFEDVRPEGAVPQISPSDTPERVACLYRV